MQDVSPFVQAAAEALAAVVAVDPSEVPGPLALEDTRVLLAMREQLDAHLLRRLRDVEVRGLHDLDALPTIGTWVEAQGSSVDRRMVALARRLDRLPTVSRELDAGRLSMLAAQRVGAAVEQLRGFLDRPDGRIDGQDGEAVLAAVLRRGVPALVGEALGGLADDDPRLVALLAELGEVTGNGRSQAERLEAAFVALARRVEPRFLRSAFELLVDALLPQRLVDRSAEAHRRRALALERHDDRPGWRLEGDIDDETGELLHTALAAAMATDPDNVTDTAAAAEVRVTGSGPGRRPVWCAGTTRSPGSCGTGSAAASPARAARWSPTSASGSASTRWRTRWGRCRGWGPRGSRWPRRWCGGCSATAW